MPMDKFIPPKPLNTAVLFLVFNRLNVTKHVFQSIRQAKPPRLYIAADGARKDKTGEAEKIAAVRDYVLPNIDWNCEVKTLFREENLGCKYAVSSAIDWFFKQEEMGIILEDDCLPSQSFFWFCEELLERYKNDTRVWHISGCNFQDGQVRGDGDYYFAKYIHVWGWASWANRWKYYDVDMKSYEQFNASNQIPNLFYKKESQQYWSGVFSKTWSGKIDTWDYQWVYTVLSNSGLSILPNKNLISNIGFGPDAVHTTNAKSKYSKLPKYELPFPPKNPLFILQSSTADEFTESKMRAFRKNKRKNILSRIANWVMR